MAILSIPRAQLDAAWDLGLGRLEGYATLALGSRRQQEVATNAYSAAMFALRYLEIVELGHKTACHTELIDVELRTVLDELARAGIVDAWRASEAWVIFHYWIVGYWDADPASAHLAAVQGVLVDLLRFFLERIGAADLLARVRDEAAPPLPAPTPDSLAVLLAEVRHLYDTLDVGEW